MVSFELLELKPKQQRCKYWLFFNQCSSGKFSKIFLAPDNKTANEINRAPVTLKAPGICCKFSRENRKKNKKMGKKSALYRSLSKCTISMIYKKHEKDYFHQKTEINRALVTLKALGICCKFSRENRKKIRKWEKNQHCIAACPSVQSV